MGSGRKLALLALLALAGGFLRAAESPDLVYKLRLPRSAARVDWHGAIPANWDVTVSVDPETCVLSCEYRLKRHSPAAKLIAPPALTLRVYSDFVSLPQTFVVDPAGLESPSLVRMAAAFPGATYIPGRKNISSPALRQSAGLPALSAFLQGIRSSYRQAGSPLVVPLRI